MNNDLRDLPEQYELEKLKALKEQVRIFFDEYLNVMEVSDNDVEFFPIIVSCCRCLEIEGLNQVLKNMQVLSDAKPKPEINKIYD